MDSYITSLMTNLGYFGMFLGMVLEAVIIIVASINSLGIIIITVSWYGTRSSYNNYSK